MKFKNIFTGSALVLILSACASEPIDPLDPTVGSKKETHPQCPIGFEPVYSTEIVIKSTDDDKKTGKAQKTYKCVPIK